MVKCAACGKFTSATGGVGCSVCPAKYHRDCVSLPEGSPINKGWVCPGCKPHTRKGDNTPVRAAMQDTTATRAAAADPPAPLVPPAPALLTAPILDVQDMHREMAEWMLEIREFRREMAEFRATVAGLSSRMDSFEQRLEAVEQRREESPPEVADLRCQVALLQQELNERDQEALLSDLEIGHLPEERGENVVHAVTVLASKLGVTLEPRDVVFAERVGVAQGAAAASQAPRERRVVVRLARRDLRDQMLQGARVRRTLTAADAGHSASTGRIFINERLTRANRILFHRVREECRRLQWRYSWTKRGRIYARQVDGKPAYPFKTLADVERVFGSTPV